MFFVLQDTSLGKYFDRVRGPPSTFIPSRTPISPCNQLWLCLNLDVRKEAETSPGRASNHSSLIQLVTNLREYHRA
jgi:hypothetical protein